MKNNLKRMFPYILINAFIWGIIGALIGKNIAEIHNTGKKLNADNEALEKWIKEAGLNGTTINIKDIDECDVPEDIRNKANDPKDPMDPTVIYVYN